MVVRPTTDLTGKCGLAASDAFPCVKLVSDISGDDVVVAIDEQRRPVGRQSTERRPQQIDLLAAAHALSHITANPRLADAEWFDVDTVTTTGSKQTLQLGRAFVATGKGDNRGLDSRTGSRDGHRVWTLSRNMIPAPMVKGEFQRVRHYIPNRHPRWGDAKRRIPQEVKHMFAIPGQPILSLTTGATEKLRNQLLAVAKTASWVRIGIKRGGCAGMEYTMDFTDAPEPHDERVEQDGVRVAIAPAATMFLIGTEIDYKTGLLESGFSFSNPNVVESCGCGESVKFAVEPSNPSAELA